MRFLSLFLISFLFATPSFADVPQYRMIKEKSFLKFIAIQNGAPVGGQFNDFTATIRFDEKNLEQCSIEAEVATGSLAVSNDDVAKNMRLPEWLSIDAFPKATFKSKKFNRTPMTDDYFVEGDMTIRGKTQPATLHFSLKQVENNAIATGYITLKRNQFGVGQGEWQKDDVVKYEVRVEFRIFTEKNN